MKTHFSRIYQLIINGILILLTFIYFQNFVDPLIINFKQQPIFILDNFFFNNYISSPGGFSDYLSLFFTQFFGLKFIGSVIITLIIWASIFVTQQLLKRQFTSNWIFVFQYIPFVALIFLFSKYSFNLKYALVFILSVGLAILYLRLKKLTIYLKPLVFIPVIVAFFYLFGIIGVVFFTLLISIGEFHQSTVKNAILVTALSALTALLTIYLITQESPYINFKMLIEDIQFKNTGISGTFLLVLLFAFLPLLQLMKPLISKLSIVKMNPKAILPICITIVLGASIFSFTKAYQPIEKKLIQIHYFANIEKWNEVIKVGSTLPKDDRKVLFEINRALYHQNELLEKAFSHNQFYGIHGLILTANYNSSVLMMCSDLYRDMGHIKESTHWAFEAQTKNTYAPDVLKRIVENNILMGNFSVAEKFLNILSKSMMHKKWANDYRKYIGNENAINANLDFVKIRKLMSNQDFFSNAQNPDYDLHMLLKEHPTNKMAFEYFVTYQLMNHNLAMAIPMVKKLNEIGYSKIPTHLEEAILLFKTLNENGHVDLGGYSVSKETMDRFIGYSKILMRNKGNKKMAQPELKKEYEDTYWYYVHFLSPITNKRELKSK